MACGVCFYYPRADCGTGRLCVFFLSSNVTWNALLPRFLALAQVFLALALPHAVWRVPAGARCQRQAAQRRPERAAPRRLRSRHSGTTTPPARTRHSTAVRTQSSDSARAHAVRRPGETVSYHIIRTLYPLVTNCCKSSYP